MKYLLAITMYLLFSTSHANNSLVDPDSIDSGMKVVSYLIPENNLKVTGYERGSPSKLKVKLCNICLKKTYKLSPTAELRLLNEPLNKEDLTEALLRKKHPLLRLVIDRNKGIVIYLHIGVNKDDEFVPTILNTNKHSTSGAIL